MSAQEKPPAKLRSLVENHGYLITAISALIGVLAPAGYISGYTYHSFYLAAFGVNSDLFALPTADAYTTAFYVVFLYLTDGLTELLSTQIYQWLGFGILLFTLVVYVGVKIGLMVVERQEKCFPLSEAHLLIRFFHPENNDLTKVAILVAQSIGSLSKPVTTGLVVIVIWLSIPTFSGLKAQSAANSNIQTYLEKGCVQQTNRQLSTCSKLISKDNRVLAEGLLVAVSGNKAAFFTQQGSLILTVPSDAHLVRELMPSDLSDKAAPETAPSIVGGDSAQ